MKRKIAVVSACLIAKVHECASSSWVDPKAKWHHVMFETVRLLKSDPETENMNEREIADFVEQCLAHSGGDFTIYEGIDDNEQGREELMGQWKRIRYGIGQGPLDEAWKRARASPVAFETSSMFRCYVPFLNLCYYLQEINGEEPIALPVIGVGKQIGVTGAMVGAYIAAAKAERYLVQVGRHYFNPKGGGKARTFRFYKNRNPAYSELMMDSPQRGWQIED